MIDITPGDPDYVILIESALIALKDDSTPFILNLSEEEALLLRLRLTKILNKEEE